MRAIGLLPPAKELLSLLLLASFIQLDIGALLRLLLWRLRVSLFVELLLEVLALVLVSVLHLELRLFLLNAGLYLAFLIAHLIELKLLEVRRIKQGLQPAFHGLVGPREVGKEAIVVGKL